MDETMEEQLLLEALYALNRVMVRGNEQDDVQSARDIVWTLGQKLYGWRD